MNTRTSVLLWPGRSFPRRLRARTEAFTWLTGAVALGQAAAVTVAGQLEDRLFSGAGFLVPMGGTLPR